MHMSMCAHFHVHVGVCVCVGSGLASWVKRLVASLCVQGHWRESQICASPWIESLI